MKHPEGNMLEFKAGIFVLFGLLLLGGMVIYFTEIGGGFQKYYQIKVEFPNAAGLLKDSDVLLAGAKIGKVTTAPVIRLEPEKLERGPAVMVQLSILEENRIPTGSRFLVGSSGLLGDRFVEVLPPLQIKAGEYVEAGSTLAGSREFGIQDLAVEGGALIEDLKEAVGNINSAVVKLDERLFSEAVVGDLTSTMGNLRKTSESFASASGKIEEASGKLSKVLDGAAEAVTSGKEAMDSAKAVATDLQPAVADLRKLIGRGEALIQTALTGQGLLPALLTDESVKENTRALVENLRKRGILFYRDQSSQDDSPDAGQRPRGRAVGPPSHR